MPISRPRQAVILAGGRGTRLRPLTDTQPKAMIPFHGKPFAAYLVELLRSQGFTEVLFLLGYLPDRVEGYFGDGSDFGVRIRYSITDPDALTSTRMRVAEPLLDDNFLLLYCDNYWPVQADTMWTALQRSGAKALITVYGNKDRSSRDNVIIGSDGFVRAYDPSRKASGLRGVEIGFAMLQRTVLDLLPSDEAPFEHSIYPKLVEQNSLFAFVTDHKYYSVSTPERLHDTEAFLKRRPAIILDRDGVLNRRPPRGEYVCSWSEFKWIPGSLEALLLLKEAGYRIILVSNQAGIARGALTEHTLQGIHAGLRAQVRSAGGDIDAIYYCPHGWDDGCECRKPRPGMLFRAQQDFHLDLSRTVFVGDDERDAQAAEAAGCPWEMVSDRRPLISFVQRHLRALPVPMELLAG